MSTDNLEIVKGIYAATEGMEIPELLAALPAIIAELCHEDVEWIEDPTCVDSQTFVGHAGVLKSFEHLIDTRVHVPRREARPLRGVPAPSCGRGARRSERGARGA